MRLRVSNQIDTVIGTAADLVDEQADRVRKAGDRLSKGGITGGAAAADLVAREVEGIGDKIAEVEPEQVIEVAHGAARRGPWLFMAGGAALGLVTWGVLRATADGHETETGPSGELEAGEEDEEELEEDEEYEEYEDVEPGEEDAEEQDARRG
jgi:hypothetical protein